jgi:hypothetical protein
LVYESRARGLACAGALAKHSLTEGVGEDGYFSGSRLSASWKFIFSYFIFSRLMIALIDWKPNMKPSSACSRLYFGRLLWKILGGRAANKRVAAQRLGIGVRFLTKILYGRKAVSQRLLAKKRWRDVLAKYYPAGWEPYAAEFDECVAHFRVSRAHCRAPRMKSGLGHVLWLILGGRKMDLMKAATQLNINRTCLSGIIHGLKKSSQQYVNKAEWREILREDYPDGWKKYGAIFDERARVLSERAGVLRTEPKDRNSFAYILWLILGGKDLNVRKVSERLDIHPTWLSRLFHGLPVSQNTLIRKRWREVLASEYGEGWRKHADEFEQYAATLPVGADVKKRSAKIARH